MFLVHFTKHMRSSISLEVRDWFHALWLKDTWKLRNSISLVRLMKSWPNIGLHCVADLQRTASKLLLRPVVSCSIADWLEISVIRIVMNMISNIFYVNGQL